MAQNDMLPSLEFLTHLSPASFLTPLDRPNKSNSRHLYQLVPKSVPPQSILQRKNDQDIFQRNEKVIRKNNRRAAPAAVAEVESAHQEEFDKLLTEEIIQEEEDSILEEILAVKSHSCLICNEAKMIQNQAYWNRLESDSLETQCLWCNHITFLPNNISDLGCENCGFKHTNFIDKSSSSSSIEDKLKVEKCMRDSTRKLKESFKANAPWCPHLKSSKYRSRRWFYETLPNPQKFNETKYELEKNLEHKRLDNSDTESQCLEAPEYILSGSEESLYGDEMLRTDDFEEEVCDTEPFQLAPCYIENKNSISTSEKRTSNYGIINKSNQDKITISLDDAKQIFRVVKFLKQPSDHEIQPNTLLHLRYPNKLESQIFPKQVLDYSIKINNGAIHNNKADQSDILEKALKMASIQSPGGIQCKRKMGNIGQMTNSQGMTGKTEYSNVFNNSNCSLPSCLKSFYENPSTISCSNASAMQSLIVRNESGQSFLAIRNTMNKEQPNPIDNPLYTSASQTPLCTSVPGTPLLTSTPHTPTNNRNRYALQKSTIPSTSVTPNDSLLNSIYSIKSTPRSESSINSDYLSLLEKTEYYGKSFTPTKFKEDGIESPRKKTCRKLFDDNK